MSKGRDFKKELADVAKRKDISQAEVDFKMRKIYEQQARALKKELKAIDNALNAHTQLMEARARLTQATQRYTELLAKQAEQATRQGMQQVARETAEAHVKAEQQMLQDAGAQRTAQAGILAQNEANATAARVVDGIGNGSAYSDRIGLSQRIWGNSRAIHDDIQTIITNAIQQGKSIAGISDLITKYVDPSARKDWNKLMEDGFKVHRRNVEYNAQRLARTASQHAYQKATEDRARGNPFITGFRWLANGSRPCPLCLERDGNVYAKGTAPLDHPNGMCVLVPVMGDDDGGGEDGGKGGGGGDDDERLLAWIRGGEDRELTAYARSLGYEV
jgi:hypothetical protein